MLSLKQNIQRMHNLRMRARESLGQIRRELDLLTERIRESHIVLQTRRTAPPGLVATDTNVLNFHPRRRTAHSAASRAEEIWRSFLVHCGNRPPEFGLAVDYVLGQTDQLSDALRVDHAARMLQELHTRAVLDDNHLRWREPDER